MPGSIRRSMRSRTGSLPRSRWRSIDRSSPPAPRPATLLLAALGGRRPARPSPRGWPASRRPPGRAGCAGRACADDRSRAGRGTAGTIATVPRPCRDLVASSRSPCSSSGLRRVRPSAVARCSRCDRAARDRHDARRPVRGWPCGDSVSVDRDGNVRVRGQATERPRRRAPGPAPCPRRGDRHDRFRGDPRAPVHGRMPDRRRRAGVHLRVRDAVGTRALRDVRVGHRLRPAALRGLSTALGPFIALPTT